MLHLAGHPGSDEHAMARHPERPGRLVAVSQGIDDLHLGSDVVAVPPRAATTEELERVHDAPYLEALAEFCADGGGSLDGDTYATPQSWSAALHAAGAGLAVVESLERAGDGVGFVAARPPGHHARPGRAMGFCLINNVAVTAAALRDRGERVLVVDWDVHHGNGTQEIFWDDPEVLYVSTHEYPLYPGTGSLEETGGASARGSTVNIPLPGGATGDVLLRAVEDVVAPAAEQFAPTWLLVSAGFDAHRDDPLASLELSAGDFAALARSVAQLVPSPGRTVLFLEGGYDLGALRRSVAATLGTLLDADSPRDHDREAPTQGGPGMSAVAHAARIHDPLEAGPLDSGLA
jgi:acetoin utilization deacetylase AcuC-like enzyme